MLPHPAVIEKFSHVGEIRKEVLPVWTSMSWFPILSLRVAPFILALNGIGEKLVLGVDI